MGLKGDLLELIAEAPGSFRTFEAQLEMWIHHGLARQAFEQLSQSRGRSISFASGGRVPRDTSDEHLRILVERPSRWSITGDRIDVSDGRRHWVGSGGHVVEMDHDEASLDTTQIGILIAPGVELLGGLQFGIPEEAEVAGRRCWRVNASTATVKGNRGPLYPGMGLSGIDHTIWFDATTGMILRHVGLFQGRKCSTSEFSDVRVDETIDETLFTYTPDSDTTVERRVDQLIRMAEERGIDLSGLDKTDEIAVQSALHAGFQTRPAAPEETRTARRSKHIPIGLPPADEAGARAAIEFAYEHNDEVAEDGSTLVNVHGGQNLAELLKRAATRVPSGDSSAVKMVVDDVLFLRPDEAVVWFGVEVDGQRFAMVDGREGRAVLVDGRWMIEHATMIDLIGFAGVSWHPPGQNS